MLLGVRIMMHTDHQNLTHRPSQFTTQQDVQWQLPLEEFGKGSENCVANALSRVPTTDENVMPAMTEMQFIKVDDLLTECLGEMPNFDEQNCHPFQFETIAHCQSLNDDLMNLPAANPGEFSFWKFGSHYLVCHTTGD